MEALSFKPFPNLTTEHLTLRQLDLHDENEIFVLRSDERVLKYIDIPIAQTIEDAQAFINKIINGAINNESVYWGITLNDDTKLIGTICLWNISEDHFTADIGYMLHPDFQGKGIMQEAISKTIEYGFETMKLKSMEADVDPNNSKSIKLLERNGFVYNRKSENTVVYSLTNPAMQNKEGINQSLQ
jgi:ribosomal-protein-alanine N-acetyltransferase